MEELNSSNTRFNYSLNNEPRRIFFRAHLSINIQLNCLNHTKYILNNFFDQNFLGEQCQFLGESPVFTVPM
jgi:hypothetical protein